MSGKTDKYIWFDFPSLVTILSKNSLFLKLVSELWSLNRYKNARNFYPLGDIWWFLHALYTDGSVFDKRQVSLLHIGFFKYLFHKSKGGYV